MTDRDKLIDMYIKGRISYEELAELLTKLKESDLPEPPVIY